MKMFSRYLPITMFLGPAVALLFISALYLLYVQTDMSESVQSTIIALLLMTLGWAGLGVFAVVMALKKVHYARILLKNIPSEGHEHGLRALAHELHDAYDANIRLQKGVLQLNVKPPSGDEEAIAEFYSSVREKRAVQFAKDIKLLKDDFWGAAYLLRGWQDRDLPKSYKDCLTKTEPSDTA